MNKKADTGDQIMIFPFLCLMLIITAGIVAGVTIFFGSNYDFRQIDSEILNYKINSCISENEIDFSNPENFFQICKLSKNITQEYFIINLKQNDKVVYDYGDEIACQLSSKSPAYPKCTTSTLAKNQNTYSILTGSAQVKRSKTK